MKRALRLGRTKSVVVRHKPRAGGPPKRDKPPVLGHTIDADKRLVYRWRSGEATPATHYFLSLIETLPEPFAQHMLLPTGYRVERIREPGA